MLPKIYHWGIAPQCFVEREKELLGLLVSGASMSHVPKSV